MALSEETARSAGSFWVEINTQVGTQCQCHFFQSAQGQDCVKAFKTERVSFIPQGQGLRGGLSLRVMADSSARWRSFSAISCCNSSVLLTTRPA